MNFSFFVLTMRDNNQHKTVGFNPPAVILFRFSRLSIKNQNFHPILRKCANSFLPLPFITEYSIIISYK